MTGIGITFFLLANLLGIQTGSSATGVDLAPLAYFGFEPGTEGRLIALDRMTEYFKHLEKHTGRVQISEIGRTTEGRPFTRVILSAPENLTTLESHRTALARLTDPLHLTREESIDLIDSCPASVVINCSIHSDEPGPTQWAPRFAHRLATSKSPEVQRILSNLIVILLPCQNPDGYGRVQDWHDRIDSGQRQSRVPFLYHKYSGHDVNRDWFAFNLTETRLVVDRVVNDFFPQAVFDLHQMGKQGYRFFVPPYKDPTEPNIDPVLLAQLREIGAVMSGALVAEGKGGVISSDLFDAWSPSRAYPPYRGAIRVLLEAAGCHLTEPTHLARGDLSHGAQTRSWNHPLPWKGGRWSLSDVLDYYDTALFSALEHIALNRVDWLNRYDSVFRKAMKPNPESRLYVFPRRQHDPSSASALIKILIRAGVSVTRGAKPVTLANKIYPEGTLFVDSCQPFSAFARCMLDNTPYPRGVSPSDPQSRAETRPPSLPPPYDVTSHCLPLMMGVSVISLSRGEGLSIPTTDVLTEEEPWFEGEKTTIRSLVASGGSKDPGETTKAYFLRRETNENYRLVMALLSRAIPVFEFVAPKGVKGRSPESGFISPGTFVVPVQGNKAKILDLSRSLGVSLGQAVDLPDKPPLHPLQAPRVGLYESSVSNPDSGWTRFVLDQHGFETRSLKDLDIRRGTLAGLDVIVLPHQIPSRLLNGNHSGSLPDQYTGGLSKNGMRKLFSFVRKGGTLVSFGDASRLVLSQRKKWMNNRPEVVDLLASRQGRSFHAPGALLGIRVDPAHPLCYGMPAEAAGFFWGGTAFLAPADLVPARYRKNDVALSGYIRGESVIKGRGALLDLAWEKGQLVLFGFRPQFRSQTTGTFKLFFNALLRAAS